jgi:hypothetical protein
VLNVCDPDSCRTAALPYTTGLTLSHSYSGSNRSSRSHFFSQKQEKTGNGDDLTHVPAGSVYPNPGWLSRRLPFNHAIANPTP